MLDCLISRQEVLAEDELEDGEEGRVEAGGLVRASKRIRWCELDSTGGDIDPQFSEEEEDQADSVKEDFSFVGAMLSDVVDRVVDKGDKGTKTEATKDLESSRVTELQKQSPSSCFSIDHMIRS